MPKTVLTSAADQPLRVSSRAGETGIAAFVARRMTNWLRRRRIARIADLEDRILEDIGLTRTDVIWARHLPLDQNPIAALNAVAHERSLLRDHQLRRPFNRMQH